MDTNCGTARERHSPSIEKRMALCAPADRLAEFNPGAEIIYAAMRSIRAKRARAEPAQPFAWPAPLARPRARHWLPDPRQGSLFFELLETAVTADVAFEAPDGSWGTYVVRPEGRGWRCADYGQDKRTTWVRRVPIVPPRGEA